MQQYKLSGSLYFRFILPGGRFAFLPPPVPPLITGDCCSTLE